MLKLTNIDSYYFLSLLFYIQRDFFFFPLLVTAGQYSYKKLILEKMDSNGFIFSFAYLTALFKFNLHTIKST